MEGLFCNTYAKIGPNMQKGYMLGTKLYLYLFCYHQMTWHLLGDMSMCHATSFFSATLDSLRDTKIDLTNSVTLKFNGMTILQYLYKR